MINLRLILSPPLSHYNIYSINWYLDITLQWKYCHLNTLNFIHIS